MKRISMINCMLVLLTCLPSWAGTIDISAVYQTRDEGGYLMEVFLFNNTEADYISILDIHAYNRTLAWSPEGWSVSLETREVSWRTYDADYAIAPGQKKSGFLFVEDVIPAQYPWWAMGTWTYQGYVTPQPVPEPSSLLALGLGALSILGFKRRR